MGSQSRFQESLEQILRKHMLVVADQTVSEIVSDALGEPGEGWTALVPRTPWQIAYEVGKSDGYEAMELRLEAAEERNKAARAVAIAATKWHYSDDAFGDLIQELGQAIKEWEKIYVETGDE